MSLAGGMRVRTAGRAACLALLSTASLAQQTLDEWLVRARDDGGGPRRERIERLHTQLSSPQFDKPARAEWLKELRKRGVDEDAERVLAIALAESDERHELAAELRLDLAAAALAAGACNDAREVLEALDARPIGAWRALVELELAQLARFTQRFAAAQARIDGALQALAAADDDYSAQMRVHALGERLLLELEQGRIDYAARALSQIEQTRAALGEASAHSALDLPITLWRASVLVAQDDHRAAIELCDRWLQGSADDSTKPLVRYRRAYAKLLLASATREGVSEAIAELEAVLAAPQLSAPERWRGWIECARAHFRAGDDAAARRGLERADQALPEGSNDCAAPIRRSSLALALAARRPKEREQLEAALATFTPQWSALLAAWREVPRPAGGIGWLHSASSLELACDLASALCALHGPQRGAELAVDALLLAQSVGSFARELDARAGDLAALRSTLLESDEHGLLLLVLAPARSMALTVDSRKVELHELPGRLLLRAQIAPLRAEASNVSEGSIAFGSFFPGELASWVERHARLTILGAEQLGSIPFELFVSPRGERLGLSHALDYLPSGPVGLWLAEHPPQHAHRGGALLAVERPFAALRERFPQIVDLELERERLGELLEPWGRAAHSRIGGGIGIDDYDELVAREPFVLQWITHGVFDPLHDPATGVALEEAPGVAWAGDFASRSAPPVVLLSCCGGARTQLRRGEDGAQQLSSAFFRAGARAVIATAGATRLSHSTDFAAALHRELGQGIGVAESARRARVELARLSPLDPLAWGAWQVTGLGALRATPTRAENSFAWTLGAMALAAAAIWIAWRRRAQS